MSDLDRRRFLGSVAAAVPAAKLAHFAARQPAQPAPKPLDDELVHALGTGVLPAELGDAHIERVVRNFQRWLDNYAPSAELNHGYGTGDIGYAPEDPAPRWSDQLTRLDRDARQQFQRRFTELDIVSKQGIVRGHIADGRLDRMPRPHQADHVAVGLLAYFYASADATDLCYERAIGKNSCRPLSRSVDEPGPRGA